MSDDVNLLDEKGNLVSVPSEQAKDAVQRGGFSVPTSKDIENYKAQQEAGSLPGEVGAAIFGTARGASAGLSDVLATMPPSQGGLSFGPAAPPASEVISQLQQANPDLSAATEFGGALAGSVGPTTAGVIARGGKALAEEALLPTAKAIAGTVVDKETSPVVAKILSSVTKGTAKTLGSAVEGTAYGLGQSLSENALGDADLNAENILHNVGYGALYGGAFGAALGLGEGAYAGTRAALGKDIEQAALKTSIIDEAKTSPTSIPTSIEELAARNKLGSLEGFETDLPAKNAVLASNDVLAGDSMFPAHAAQINSLENSTKRLEYKMFLKSDVPTAKDFLNYEANQKYEGVNKLLPQYIKEISPDSKLADNPIDAGEKATKSFVEQYEQNKKATIPDFEKIDSVGVKSIENPEEVLPRIYADLPGAKDLITIRKEGGEELGAFKVKPYDATTGVTRGTYNQLKSLVSALNKEDLTIGGLRNLRDIMGEGLDYYKNPKEAVQIGSLRKNLMTYMQDLVNKHIPDVNIRETMKNYALNEQNREIIEKIFGGNISDKAKFGKGIEPEKVLDRIFGSLENVTAAKEILGPKFNEVAANYLNQLKNKATDPIKGFSSNNIYRTLRNKELVLKEALATHPEQLNKINAVIDKMRALPDSPPGNPSDTAAATNILKKIHQFGSLIEHPSEVLGKALKYVGGKFDQIQQQAAMDRILAGESASSTAKNQRLYSVYAKIERMGQSLTKSIDLGVKGFFKTGEKIKGPSLQQLIPSQKQEKFDKMAKKLTEFSSLTPEVINKLHASTSDLHDLAPNITNSLYMSTGRATQFLASKLPVQPPSSPFSEPLQPSPTEIAIFNRYHQAVENPLSVLEHLQTGTLTHEHIEAISTVYPKMFAKMQDSIINQLSSGKGKDLPYSKKLMLSMFTGQDMTNSLKPQNIAMSQSILAAQSQPQAPKQGAKSLSKLDKSDQLLTDNQRVERG